jgi:hypothetical protein
MIAFDTCGPLLSFTGANAAPTSVQAISLDNVQQQQVVLTNTDAANDCVIGFGSSDAVAKLNAAAGAGCSNCYYLLARSQVVITVGPSMFFSGITPGSGVTAVIKVQSGYGF